MSRRIILALAGLLLLAPQPARAADQISLVLNWYLGGLHTPFYLGLERGYYRDEGIELTINEGRGSARSVQVVASGGDTFGMADAGSLMLGAAKGQPVKAVLSLLNTSGFGVISLEETGIRTAKDLEGKRLAVSPGDALTQLFPAVVKANALDQSKIDMIFVDPAAKVVAVLEKRADALLGGIDDQYFLIQAKGFKPASLRFADLGANTVGITILAQDSTIAEKPDMVRRFVRATQKSWQAAKADPGAAVTAALKVKPDLDRASTLKQLEVDLQLLGSPGTDGKPLGFGAPGEWEKTKQLLVEYRDLKTDRPATSFFTNEFVAN